MPEVGRMRDDVSLRGRHRDAAAEPRRAEQALHRGGGEAEGAGPPASLASRSGSVRETDRGAQQQRERSHHHQAEDADPGPGLPPPDLVDSDLEKRRPHGAREIRAADDDRGSRSRAGGRTSGVMFATSGTMMLDIPRNPNQQGRMRARAAIARLHDRPGTVRTRSRRSRRGWAT